MPRSPVHFLLVSKRRLREEIAGHPSPIYGAISRDPNRGWGFLKFPPYPPTPGMDWDGVGNMVFLAAIWARKEGPLEPRNNSNNSNYLNNSDSSHNWKIQIIKNKWWGVIALIPPIIPNYLNYCHRFMVIGISGGIWKSLSAVDHLGRCRLGDKDVHSF